MAKLNRPKGKPDIITDLGKSFVGMAEATKSVGDAFDHFKESVAKNVAKVFNVPLDKVSVGPKQKTSGVLPASPRLPCEGCGKVVIDASDGKAFRLCPSCRIGTGVKQVGDYDVQRLKDGRWAVYDGHELGVKPEMVFSKREEAEYYAKHRMKFREQDVPEVTLHAYDVRVGSFVLRFATEAHNWWQANFAAEFYDHNGNRGSGFRCIHCGRSARVPIEVIGTLAGGFRVEHECPVEAPLKVDVEATDLTPEAFEEVVEKLEVLGPAPRYAKVPRTTGTKPVAKKPASGAHPEKPKRLIELD